MSPFTQYAVGKKSNTLILVCFDVMLGNFFAIAINVDDFGTSCVMASTTCSRIIASAFSLLIISVISYLLFSVYSFPNKLLIASFALVFLSSEPPPNGIGPGVGPTTYGTFLFGSNKYPCSLTIPSRAVLMSLS